MAVQRPALGHQVLEHASAGVRGLYQHEHPGRPADRCVDERLQAVVAQVRADRQGVGPPRTVPAQKTLGVGRGGRADVVPLAVQHHEQPFFAGVAHDLGQGGHSGRAKLLEEGRLGLDRRHPRGNHVHDPAAEPHESGRHVRRPAAGRIAQQARRQHVGPRVQAHQHRVPASPHRRLEPIGKRKHLSTS